MKVERVHSMSGRRANSGMSRRSKQGGAITVFGVTIAVAITTGILVAALNAQIERVEQRITESVATTMFTIGETAQIYFENEGGFPDAANDCADALTVLAADGYLVGFQPLSGWGTPFVFDCSAGTRFDISAQAPEAQRAETAASRLFTATVAGDTVTTSFPAPAAFPALDQILFRVAVPGEPERNRMETDLDMNNFRIVNARFGDANFDGNDILGVGTIEAADGNFENINVTDTADINNLVANTATIAGDTSIGGDLIAPDGDLDVLSDITIGGNNDFRWGNSQLEALEPGPGGLADGIRIGARTPGAAGAAGRSFIDMHFPGVASPNVRIWNEANGQLTLDAGRVEVTGGITTTNMVARDRIHAQGFDSLILDRRVESFVNDAGIVRSGDLVPVPQCGDLEPLIYTSLTSFGQGLAAKPVASARAYADPPSGGFWRVRMEILTEDGFQEAAPPNNEIQVMTQCG